MLYKLKKFLYLFIFSINFLAQSDDFFDCKSCYGNTSYIYSPGFFSTESSMTKYCPSFTSWTGEKFVSKNAVHILGQPHSVVIFPEIVLNQNAKSIHDYNLDLSQSDLGQTKDTQCVYNTYQKHLDLYKNSNIIMHGHSRGAVSTFNFIAEYKPSNVKAAILEGIFDDMQHCIKHFGYQNKNSFLENLLCGSLKLLIGSYSYQSLSAKDYAKKITDDIPLLFVTSLKDSISPVNGVFNLYLILKNRGFKKVHILILDNSCHSSYTTDNLPDKEKYEACVHALYKHYNLTYNTDKAKLGKKTFEQSQPDIQELINKYNLPLCNHCLFKK